jgi:hypothetical protein
LRAPVDALACAAFPTECTTKPGAEGLPSNQELLDFIRDTIRSVWALEILLVLRRDPAQVWTAQQIVDDLRASLPLVTSNLEVFETAGLALREGEGFRYAPASPWLESLCGELASAYRERPVTVINAIVSSSGDNLRALADAFRLKGNK